tara:strand:- start:177 stop:1136 length:960 start_codon:yes stop_codon:yes gene_type:complete
LTKTKLYKITNTTLSFTVGLLLLYILYLALISKEIPVEFNQLKINSTTIFYISLSCLLMLLNWSFEAIKWNLLIRKIHRLKTSEIIGSISLGLCANIIAPNRIGELAARLNYLPNEKRREGLYLNLFAASSQLLITFLSGLLASILLLPSLDLIPHTWKLPLYLSASILILFALLLFFKSQLVKRLLLNKLEKSGEKATAVHLDHASRIKVIALSTSRYVIFLIQFFLILKAFGAEIGFYEASLMLSISFLVNSFIPSNWLTEIVTKGSVIFFLFELMAYDPLIGIMASLGLWLINLLIPSLLSLYFLKDIDWMRLVKA